MKFKDIDSFYRKIPLHIKLYLYIRSIIFDFQKLINTIPVGAKKICEIGCGYGMASFMLADRYKEAEVFAYDLNQKRIKCLKAINPFSHLSFYAEDAVDITQREADVIIMADLLHHLTFEQQKVFLKKIQGMLCDEGIVVVKDMDKGRFSLRHAVNFLIDVVNTKGLTFYYHTQESFVQLFQSCGFKVQKRIRANRWFIPLNHIIFVLEKKIS